MKSIVDLLSDKVILKEDPTQNLDLKIYCDLDGVLTDFDERFEHFSGATPSEYKDRFGEAKFWNLIDNEVGLKFWAKMGWMPGGKQLWDYISKFDTQILTSPSRHENSRLGKNIWVKENLNPTPRVNFAYSSDKQRFANPNSILIDDKKSNIDEWAARGGIAVRCKDGNIKPVLDRLKELGI